MVGKVWSAKELESFCVDRLNEDPKRRDNDIKAIKDWMSKQPHLKDGKNGKLIFLKNTQFLSLSIFSQP